jgi:hypothetical protein
MDDGTCGRMARAERARNRSDLGVTLFHRLLPLLVILAGCHHGVPLCAPWKDFDLPSPRDVTSCWDTRVIMTYAETDDAELFGSILRPLIRKQFMPSKNTEKGATAIVRRERDRLQIEIHIERGVADLRKRTYGEWELTSPHYVPE